MGLFKQEYSGHVFDHGQTGKIGVLISNLGTPNAPTKKALRPYLKQFLADPRVVEFPRLLWWFILNGIILNFRPARSAKSYATVWTEEGSPLAVHTAAQAQKLAESLAESHGTELVVDWAMRYGSPSIADTVQKMLDKGVRKLVVLPLYPQYSAATTASTFDAIAADFTRRRWLPEFRFVTSYHDHPAYIEAIADSIREHWLTHERAEKLLFSYHGVPLNYLHKGDPYHCQCLATSRLVAQSLGLKDDEYLTTFQSRFGRQEWLKPYTDKTLIALAEEGITSVSVICPGFSSDCLETIEEIGEENRDYFLNAGGQHFDYIPALNSTPGHIQLLKRLVTDNLQGWLNANTGESQTTLQQRTERHDQCPFNRAQ
ncbi:ferrochelatase [Teredinibacter purpureus]|uniref:ferrochelatase n=1 Tax=Teredinibacter purpureus TaxID=2731756 RepID=UPI000A9A6ADC